MYHTVTSGLSPGRGGEEERTPPPMMPVAYGTALRDGAQRSLQVQTKSITGVACSETGYYERLQLLGKAVGHEELDFLFYYILINFFLHVPTWLSATLLDSAGLKRERAKGFVSLPGGAFLSLAAALLQPSQEPPSVRG